LEGYCSCPKLFNSHALPLSGYHIKPLGSITYLLEFGKGIAKPKRQAIPASFCDNVINHETNEFLKNTYSMLTI